MYQDFLSGHRVRSTLSLLHGEALNRQVLDSRIATPPQISAEQSQAGRQDQLL